MQPIRFAGIGAGLDLESLIGRMLAAERAGPLARIERVENQTRAERQAFDNLRTSATALQDAVAGLRRAAQSPVMTTNLPEDAPFALSVADGSFSGAFSVEVEALARAQKLRSAAFDPAAEVGNGTLTISVAGQSFDVAIAAGDGTPEAIAAAINDAADNTGVRVSVINGDAGAQMVFTARDSGAANTITINASGGDGGLDALRFNNDPGNDALTEIAQASDAAILVDGVRLTSDGNRFENVIDGVTIDALRAQPGDSLDVQVSRDREAQADSAQALVDAFNALRSRINTSTRFNPEGADGGPLQGDAATRRLSAAVRSALDVQLPGADLSLLSEIGIETNANGNLEFDRDAFLAAAASNTDDVDALLGGADGLATRMDTALGQFLGSDGLFASRIDSLDSRLSRVDDDRARLDLRLERVESRLRSQFLALDRLMGELNSTTSFLTQQLGGGNG